MANGYIDFNSVYSDDQIFDFYDSSFGVVVSNQLDIDVYKLKRLEDHIELLSSFSIEPFETTRGRVESFDSIINVFAEVEVSDTVEGINLSSIFSPPFVVNYKETVRYTTLDDYSSVNIAIPDEIKFLGLKLLQDFQVQVADVIIGDSRFLKDSAYSEILHKANKAKVVGFRQNFWPYNTDYNYYAKIQDTHILIDTFIELFNVGASFPELISFDKVDQAAMVFEPTAEASYIPSTNDGNENLGTIDLAGIDSVRFSYVHADDINIYSPPMSLMVDGESLEATTYSFTTDRDFDSFGPVLSSRLTMIQLTAAIDDYEIVDFEPYYSHPWSPTLNVYHPEDFIHLNEYTIPFAEWNDHRDIEGTTFFIGKFSITEIDELDLAGNTFDFVDLSYEVPSVVYMDVDPMTSPWMKFLLADLVSTKKDGLYRDVYVDDYGQVVHPKTPWLMNNGSLKKVTTTKFYDIGFDASTVSMFLLNDAKFPTITLDWEQVFVDDNKWNMPHYDLSPYIRLESEDNGDFIIIALASTGGSVVHIHASDYMDSYSIDNVYNVTDDKLLAASQQSGTGVLIDSTEAEVSAKTVASAKYRKYAKVLHETNLGFTYDQYVIDDAVRYMETVVDRTNFFFTAPYNAIVLSSIINDKGRGLVDNNVFQQSHIQFYNGVPFSHQDDVALEFGGMKFMYVDSHSHVYLSESKSVLQTIFVNKNISGSKTSGIIDNCGINGACANKLLSDLNSIGAIALPELATGVGISVPDMAYGGEKTIPFEIEIGIVDIPPFVLSPYVEISLYRDYENIVSKDSNLTVTIGTSVEPVYYPGHFTLGTVDLEGFVSEDSNFSLSLPDTTLEEVYADFWMRLHIDLSTDTLDSVYSEESLSGVNKGFVSLEDHHDRVESIWMKMFFPSVAGESVLSARFMDFNITTQEFAKDFILPYAYVDDAEVVGVYSPNKSGVGDIMEKKLKEIEPSPDSKSYEKPADIICSEFRTTTYLEYQGFDHIFTINTRKLHGNYPMSTKETIMSAFIRISVNAVISPGKSLADLDIMSKSLAQVKLSFIEDLDVVENWNIEDFELDTADFGLNANQSELLSSIDEVFRNALKSVINTLGDDIIYADTQDSVNRFPAFPERPAPGDELATSIKVKQYFAVEETVVQN